MGVRPIMGKSGHGKWKYRQMGIAKSAKGMRELDKSANKYNMNIAHTSYNPENNNRAELITWASGGGKIEKLDSITICNGAKIG